MQVGRAEPRPSVKGEPSSFPARFRRWRGGRAGSRARRRKPARSCFPHRFHEIRDGGAHETVFVAEQVSRRPPRADIGMAQLGHEDCRGNRAVPPPRVRRKIATGSIRSRSKARATALPLILIVRLFLRPGARAGRFQDGEGAVAKRAQHDGGVIDRHFSPTLGIVFARPPFHKSLEGGADFPEISRQMTVQIDQMRAEIMKR